MACVIRTHSARLIIFPIQLRDQNMKQTCLLMAAFAICMTAGAQTRYLDEVFSDVDVTSNIQYGTNVTVITALQGQPPAAQPLVLDLYEPAGDTETDRPLLLYFHTGNFLPQYVNGSPLGTKTDSSSVEICTRYAKMGYVVASVGYGAACCCRCPRRLSASVRVRCWFIRYLHRGGRSNADLCFSNCCCDKSWRMALG